MVRRPHLGQHCWLSYSGSHHRLSRMLRAGHFP